MKKGLYLALAILLLVPGIGWADISKEEAITEFVQGNLSYKEGDYERAIDKYTSIIKEGKASGPLYYNLANTYYRQGNLGRAILNYERARRLMPRDGDLNFNYNYVRSKANLFEGRIGTSFLQNAVEEHVSFYSVDEMLKIVTLILFVMAGLHLLALYQQWSKRLRRVGLAILLVLFIVFSGGLYLKIKKFSDQAVILTKTEAKFEPREDSTTHYRLTEGSKVKVLKQDGDWMKIERPDGKQGWLPQKDVEKI